MKEIKTHLSPRECLEKLQGFEDALNPDSGWKRTSPGFLLDASIPKKNREGEETKLNTLYEHLKNLNIPIHKHALGLDNACMAGGCWAKADVRIWINPVRIHDCSILVHEETSKKGDDALAKAQEQKEYQSELNESQLTVRQARNAQAIERKKALRQQRELNKMFHKDMAKVKQEKELKQQRERELYERFMKAMTNKTPMTEKTQ